jgi:hypothetical protein
VEGRGERVECPRERGGRREEEEPDKEISGDKETKGQGDKGTRRQRDKESCGVGRLVAPRS